MNNPPVGIIVLSYKQKALLKQCLNSLIKQTYKNKKIYLVDNNSNDGSVNFTKENYPTITIIENKQNVGYAKGNNLGLEKAFNDSVKFCIIVNTDTKADKNLVTELIECYKSKKQSKLKVGLIQPIILLSDKPTHINTIGNAIHYIGYGYCKDYLKKRKPLKGDIEIASASGACLLLSKEYYLDIGCFDEDFFLYNEDENISWRGLLKGYHHYLAKNAIIYHRYSFNKGNYKLYHSEKNRIMILLENYSIKTLFLLSPILLLNEFMMLTFSLISRWFFYKLKGYFYIISNMNIILKKRKKIQSERIISDNVIMKTFDSTLDFAYYNNIIIKNFINPIFKLYYRVIINLI